jgi:ferritin-like metal-binding protein YciE
MGWFTNIHIDTLKDLLLYQLKDLYDSEHQLTSALPKMAEASSSPALKAAFEHHLIETETHVARLERIFRELKEEPKRETCPAMKGMIAEGHEIIDSKGDKSVKDAALIAAAQRVEHYEMAGYGCSRAFAEKLGYTAIALLLQQTLDEEGQADRSLTAIAEGSVNRASAKTMTEAVVAA